MKRPPLPSKTAIAMSARRGGGQGEPAPHPVPPAFEPLLLDSREVSRLLGISRTKAFQMIATGGVPVIRIGRCARVPRAALERWISQQTKEPRSPTLPSEETLVTGAFGGAHT
jgi:excisionase family DNA binding protein